MPREADTLARVPIVAARLKASVNGYVLVKRFALRDRGALKQLIEEGKAEIFKSPLGRAYRLKPPSPRDGDA